MYAVPRRPYNLGHVRPHRIESHISEKAAIAGAGDWNLALVGLLPDVRDDVGTPVIVAQFLVFGIGHSKEDVLLALLDAAHTAYAEYVGGIHYLGRIELTLLVNIIDAGIALDATHASKAAVAFNCIELRHLEEPRFSRFYFNVISDRHIICSHIDGRGIPAGID